MYRRYGGSADSIFSMPFSDGCELIEYALDAENEDRLFLRWAVMYQSQMGFAEFKEVLGAGKEPEDNRTAEEILDSVRKIIG